MSGLYDQALLVTGTRGPLADEDLELLQETLYTRCVNFFTLLIIGDADGVDTDAVAYLRTTFGKDIVVDRHIADWSLFGNAAGPIRNHEMVMRLLEADADERGWLAYPGPRSKGTWNCLKRAVQSGVSGTIHPLGAS